MKLSYTLKGALIVKKRGIDSKGRLSVEGDKIVGPSGAQATDIGLSKNAYVYPGLINIHDHLRGDYLPRVGPKAGRFYLNWSFWDNDLKGSEVFHERAAVSVEECYFLGAYKNLFSGVTTVNDHFNHEFNEPYMTRFPLRVIRNYTLAHECSSFDLKWGRGIEIEHADALRLDWPFITHLEEGFDAETQNGIEILERAGCLDDHCVLIHCIGFSQQDIRKCRKAGAHLAWCPASNLFMFNTTLKVRDVLKAGINLSLGTDSTHTGSVNLLEEIRYARTVYRRMYGEELAAKTLFEMVTVNPARAFRMEDRIGALEEGRQADILVLRPRKDDPYEALVEARMADIELLIQDGAPLLGEARYEELFERAGSEFTRIRIKGRDMLVKGDPGRLMSSVQKKVGFSKKLAFMPFEY